MTTRDPETGERDLDTLRLLKEYRGQRESDGAVLFGVYATVERRAWFESAIRFRRPLSAPSGNVAQFLGR